MNKFFYPKLAASNLKKHHKTYLPYILSSVGTIMMYYMMYSLAHNQGLGEIFGGDTLKLLLTMGTYVIGIFALIFLFYTNSFLLKRRKKEFGLLNILGMEKKHIAKMMFFETLYVAGFSLILGVLGGILFSKLMQLLLLKLLQVGAQFGFGLSLEGIGASLLIFGGIFALTFLNTLGQIHLANPIDLLKGGQVGEKEPKTNWLLALGGVITLGAGYYIALTVQSPLAAINLFFVAVLLVIIGTNLLFVSGSTVFLKALRKNKGYYYQTKHFIAISGLLYRMKQNAAGLANICILSTAVLVMLSTTFSLYIGMEDVLRNRYPRDFTVTDQTLSADEILIYGNTASLNGDLVTINGALFRIKERLTGLNVAIGPDADLIGGYYMVMADEAMTRAVWAGNSQGVEEGLYYNYAFDTGASSEAQIALSQMLLPQLRAIEKMISLDAVETNRGDVYALYGGLFFLGIFLGALFIMATVLIIY